MNIVCHISKKNFRFLFDIMTLKIFQFAMFNQSINVKLHCDVDQIILSNMKITRLLNLHIIDIAILYSLTKIIDNVMIKSIMIVWKSTNDFSIDWNESYDWCFLIWYIKHFEQWRKYSRKCLFSSLIYQFATIFS